MHAPTPDLRLSQLADWLGEHASDFGLRVDTLRPASDDASFRRYFRIDLQAPLDGAESVVAMDAPPPMEDVRPFVHAADVLGATGMQVPRVLARDVERGFLLLEDFGSTTYMQVLDAATAPALYTDASAALVRLQAGSREGVFPEYDRALLARELALYPDWYVARHKGVTLSDDERNQLARAFDALLDNNVAQPRVFVHRDYHSRNLMLLPGDRNPGVLDFQDAVHGPITYDLVSLLRDAYVEWEEEQVLDWTIRHWERARRASLPVASDFANFWRDFEWMGLQRHLKVLGIFARLNYRDGKDRYLADLPRVLGYVQRAARRYIALDPLVRVMERIEGESREAGYTF